VDGILVLVSVCAAWAFLKALESKNFFIYCFPLHYWSCCNTKCSRLILPAGLLCLFLKFYSLMAEKIVIFIGAGVVLLIISFSWILAVDFTPAASRPYVAQVRQTQT